MLKLCNIKKSFGEKEVLRDVSLSLEKGDIAVLAGASGGGKTTLLRIAAGLESADGGTVEKEGRLAVVFAEARLFPSATVLQNVTAVMKGEKKANIRRAKEILETLALADAAQLYPREISSGMAARVSLARAMAFDADVYLLDEPLKSLDEALKENVMEALLAFFKEKTVLVISHDAAESKKMATRYFRLEDGRLSEQAKTDKAFF